QVQRSLEHAIFTGELKPGERLLEVELADALQVSRASLREALRLLENKGLVVTTHRRGAYVIELSDDDVREIYGVRLLLEDHAMRCATSDPTPELVSKLEALIEEMRYSAARRDYFAIVDLDLDFHREICTAAGNGRLLTMWGDLVAPTRALLLTKYRLFDDSEEISNGHVILLNAIQAGDQDRAVVLLKRHVTDTHEQILQSLASERIKTAIHH
ncbi:MAG: GntR family transcriptional regulator, partial [Thermomicrobiales bacterium]